eukprot:scaffold5920_cov114-Isochrysis_galbana.AAC.8
MGDAGITALASALRVNRTLAVLSIDNNAAGVDGLKALHLALKGNKKVVALPLPEDDVAAALREQASAYKASLVRELDARGVVKSAYMRGGYVNHRRKDQGLEALKQAKQQQARARINKDKLRTAAASVAASVARNQEVAQVKRAGKDARAESRLAAQAAAAAKKAREKANKLRGQQKQTIWLARHKLLDAWTRHAKALAAQGSPQPWYADWHQSWGKPYMSPQGLASALRAMPLEQKESWSSLKEQAEDTFAAEEGLDAQVEAILNEERQHRAQAEWHDAEVQYYGMLSTRDPASVSAPPVQPGILQSAVPGKERPGQFGMGFRTDWARRYQWITSQLKSAIHTDPPADYKWQGLARAAGEKEVHAMVTYPQAKAVEAQASVAMGLPVLQGADAGGATYGADGLPVGTALPYPAKPVKDSVYAAPPPPAGKPEPPRPVFAPQTAVPVPPAQTMLIVVPPGVTAGQQMQVQLPGGGRVQCAVPAGAVPGSQIQLRVPAANPAPGPPPPDVPTKAATELYKPPQHKQYTYTNRKGAQSASVLPGLPVFIGHSRVSKPVPVPAWPASPTHCSRNPHLSTPVQARITPTRTTSSRASAVRATTAPTRPSGATSR